MRFKIDWASLIVGSKFTVFALFYFVFEGNFPSTSPRGLIFGGAYTWRGLFSEFYGIFQRPVWGYKAVSYLSLDFFLSVHRYSSYN